MRRCGLFVLALALGWSLSVRADDWYVAVDGDDRYDGSSPTAESETKGPKLSFASLMSSVNEGDTIWVMPGEHQAGTMDSSDTASLSRIHITKKNVTLRSYSGNPSDTAIVGWGSADNRSDAEAPLVRCVSLSTTAKDCIIDGLTLKDGVACCADGLRRYGGGVDDRSSSCWLVGCVVTNCHAYAGGGVYGCKAVRTHFVDCYGDRVAWGAAMYMGVSAEFCLFERCCPIKKARTIGGDSAVTKLYNCTFTGGKNGVLYNKNEKVYTVINCLSVDNNESNAGMGPDMLIVASNTVFGTIVGSRYVTFDNCITNVTKTEARFIDSASGDWRVSGASPAAERGDATVFAGVQLPDGYVRKDFYGKVVPTSGPIAAGCAIETPPCVVVGAGLSAAGLNAGVNDLLGEHPATYTFELSPSSLRRPFVGLSVNGVVQPGLTVPAPGVGETLRIEVVSGTNWYVDAATGSDDPLSGGTPGRPKATIRAATTNAVSGDVVHVAPGTYGAAEGSRLQQDAQTRVIVPNGVRLQADGAPGTTVIRGAAATEGDDYGNGPDAVRCVYLFDNATIANFTLTDGHTASVATGGGGSAVYSRNLTATVVDCLVTNNFCYQGTVRSGWIVRCRIVDNTASYRGSLGDVCSYYGCFLDRSHAANGRNLNNPLSMDFCTIGKNHTWINDGELSDSPQVLAAGNVFPMRNSVMAGGRIWSVGNVYATNCVFHSNISELANGVDCQYMSVKKMKLSENGVPAADSLLNNAGSVELAPDCVNETDLAGVPRVLNGGVDAGAFEHDWRQEYTGTLGAKRVEVTFASPTPTQGEAAVELNGGEVRGTFVADGSVRLRFAVEGAGTLSLYVNGELIGAYSAGATEAIVEVAAGDAFRLVHEVPSGEAGAARLCRFGGTDGLILLVR